MLKKKKQSKSKDWFDNHLIVMGGTKNQNKKLKAMIKDSVIKSLTTKEDY